MGLAASQARLLSITSRRSDCEYQSMDLSHQKIALSRDMNIVSAEYQDALNKTKIIYDFYGTGDKNTLLSYNLLMTPSKLNDYVPSPVTDPSGRVVLDASLAAAARAAGIPQEGLGCTPSSDLRDRFIDSLSEPASSSEPAKITKSIAASVKNVPYNPKAGLGEADIPLTKTRTVTFSEFIEEFLKDEAYDFTDLTLKSGGCDLNLYSGKTKIFDAGSNNKNIAEDDRKSTVTFEELLNGSYSLMGLLADNEDHGDGWWWNCAIDKVGSSNFWDVLFNTLESRLSKDDNLAQAALGYAKQQTLAKVISLATTADDADYSNSARYWRWHREGMDHVTDRLENTMQDYVGYAFINNSGGKYNSGYACSMTNMAKAFYTYFAMYMEGLATTDFKVTNEKSSSTFVTESFNAASFSFDIVEDLDVTGDSALIANFYDCLFNQICVNGWIENNNVGDNEYFATMLKNGSMYLSAMDDDNYYYQKNYATFNYIKEVTDEEGIAVAEAKYMREKEKIKSKEDILDMKMKNLDTEITALTTEADTIKTIITNNIKGFKRYSA